MQLHVKENGSIILKNCVEFSLLVMLAILTLSIILSWLILILSWFILSLHAWKLRVLLGTPQENLSNAMYMQTSKMQISWQLTILQ